MDKEDLRGAPAAIGVAVLALMYLGVVLAIYPGWGFFINFITNNISFHFNETSILYNLLLGIVAGIFSGWMTGILITRLNRFSSIKSEALRHLNSIEYIGNGREIERINIGNAGQIYELACDLYRFKNKGAGDAFIEAFNDITRAEILVNNGNSKSGDFDKTLEKCRRLIRDSRPSLKIFIPWGSI